MGLADWEIIIGGGLDISSKYAVSGSKSLTQAFNGGGVHMVHRQTYNDNPLNVRIDTWMTIDLPDQSYYRYYIGGIARKQPDVSTYLYWMLFVEFSESGVLNDAGIDYGYYKDGSQTSLNSISMFEEYSNKISDMWDAGKWRFVRMECYQVGSNIVLKILKTPNISTPDPNNPPTDQLKELFNVSIDVPEGLENGGACGIIVGGYASGATADAKPYYDYTQIWY